MGSDSYVVRLLLEASKKKQFQGSGGVEPPTKDRYLTIVEAIYKMEKLTRKLRLQKAQLDKLERIDKLQNSVWRHANLL